MASECCGFTLKPRFIVDSEGVATVARLGARIGFRDGGLTINGIDVDCWVADAPITVEHLCKDFKTVTLTLFAESVEEPTLYKHHEPTQATIYPASR